MAEGDEDAKRLADGHALGCPRWRPPCALYARRLLCTRSLVTVSLKQVLSRGDDRIGGANGAAEQIRFAAKCPSRQRPFLAGTAESERQLHGVLDLDDGFRAPRSLKRPARRDPLLKFVAAGSCRATELRCRSIRIPEADVRGNRDSARGSLSLLATERPVQKIVTTLLPCWPSHLMPVLPGPRPREQCCAPGFEDRTLSPSAASMHECAHRRQAGSPEGPRRRLRHRGDIVQHHGGGIGIGLRRVGR